MNILPGNMRFGAGQPVKRLEDQRLLTGKGQFIDDRPEDGALWLHVLRSPNAHAKFWSIDVKSAAEMPGIEAVYAGADLIADNVGTIPTLSVFKRPDGSPMTVPPRRLLAHEIVRFAGEPVAAVVATSRIPPQPAPEAIAWGGRRCWRGRRKGCGWWSAIWGAVSGKRQISIPKTAWWPMPPQNSGARYAGAATAPTSSSAAPMAAI